jgi:carbonic anhydrase
MEFGCKVSGSKVVLVLGHEDCGALKGAIDGVELGNLTQLLAKIHPAIDRVKDYRGERTSSNKEFLKKVTYENVRHTMEHIRETSPILKEMEDNGEIVIVGGVYDILTGQVTFLD